MTVYAEEITYHIRDGGGMFNDWRIVDVEKAKTIASLIKGTLFGLAVGIGLMILMAVVMVCI